MKPSLNEARALSASYNVLPLYETIDAENHTPDEMLRTLRGVSQKIYMMENSHDTEDGAQWNRFSYIGIDPALHIFYKDGELTVESEGFNCTYACSDPVSVVKQLVSQNIAPHAEELPPFVGGLTGYFSYEYIECLEPDIKWSSENTEQFRDFDLMLMNKVFVYDRELQKIFLINSIKTENLDENYRQAQHTINEMKEILGKASDNKVHPLKINGDIKLMFSKERHMCMVDDARKRIARGDVAQIVLSNSQEAPAEGSLVDAYCSLRQNDRTRHMCYFSSDDMEAAIASPETILNISNGKLFAERLAGTYARGKNKEEDNKQRHALLSDSKSIDEHNMLVDDTRNEFGPFSEFGSIRLEKYMEIVSCSRVMHIGSVITGKLRSGFDALDAIGYISPSGVVSGTPKIASCIAISEIEKNRRGIYGAAVGYIGFDNNASFFAFIHSAYIKNGKVCVRTGGGIVIDSNPEDEFNECIDKASAMMSVLRKVDSGRMEKPLTKTVI